MLQGDRLSVAVVGASGYAAAELVAAHFPQFAGHLDERYRRYAADDVAGRAKIAFLALPHGESATAARELHARGLTVIDLSADFRLRSAATYQEWYGAHGAP